MVPSRKRKGLEAKWQVTVPVRFERLLQDCPHQVPRRPGTRQPIWCFECHTRFTVILRAQKVNGARGNIKSLVHVSKMYSSCRHPPHQYFVHHVTL